MRPTFPRLVRALSPLPVLIGFAFGGATANAQNVIDATALSNAKAGSAYDAIRQTRPEMLRTRSPGSLMLFSPRYPAVAVDNVIVGGIDVLRTIPASEVARIEYVDSWRAAKQYGLDHRDGLVLVTMRTKSEPALAAKGARSK